MDVQREKIFSEYMNLGVRGRQVFTSPLAGVFPSFCHALLTNRAYSPTKIN